VVLGGGINVFVTDEFADELKTSPHFWIGPEIVCRVQAGRSPVLDDKRLRDKNACGGLIAAVWHTGILPEVLARGEVGNTVHTAFDALHRGYQLREVLVQGDSEVHVEGVRTIGLRLWNGAKARYEAFDKVRPEHLLQKAHVLGFTRDLAATLPGCWAGTAFLYQPPRFAFRRSEQHLLSCGLLGGTDREIAEELGISLDTVRKTWRAIYDRVAAVEPRLVATSAAQGSEYKARGKAKKQRLLAYINNHPEELRPVSRKLLQSDLA
jgi:DNA-binding CsgD family transcriptional regulator